MNSLQPRRIAPSFALATLVAGVTLGLAAPSTLSATPYVDAWTRQFGSAELDEPLHLASDARGRSYLVGTTQGELPDQDTAGAGDAFIRSHAASGQHRWTRQFGTGGGDGALGVALDRDGNVYVVGFTEDDLDGDNAGVVDAFIRKYSPNGTLRWGRQFGTGASDFATAVAVDPLGHVFVVGATRGDLAGTNAGDRDVFVRRYTSTGRRVWTRQFGTGATDEATGVAADADGNVIVVGETDGALTANDPDLRDAFVRKLSLTGRHRWTRQFGSDDLDGAQDVAIDRDGNAIIVGDASGPLPGQDHLGFVDAFVRKLSPRGTHVWTRQFGTGTDDYATDVAVDRGGRAYIAGQTFGELPGQSTEGNADAFIRVLRPTGRHAWTVQFGTGAYEAGEAIAVDPTADVYVGGQTDGVLAASQEGEGDAYLRRYVPSG